MSYSHLFWVSPEEAIEHLRWVVEQDPADLHPYDKHLLFHIATRSGAPYELVMRLVDRVPDKVSEGTRYMYQTALHTTGKGTSISVVRLLLRHDKNLLRERDSWGRTFLHAAVKNGLDLKVIKLIVWRWPDSVKEATTDGMIPLHFVGKETSLEVVEFLIDTWRGSVDAKDKRNNLPLHYAAACGATLPVIQLLVALRRGSCAERDKVGRLPLHRAATGSTPEVVEFLLGKCPESIRETDKGGNLPLHSSVDFEKVEEEEEGREDADEVVEFRTPIRSEEARVNVVRLLGKRFPESVQRTNGEGLLPWELARSARYRGDIELAVIGALAEACPESLLLHEALTLSDWKVPSLVQLLAARCPEAIRLRDGDDKTPLHHAVKTLKYKEVLPVVKILIDAWREGAWAKDAAGRLPLHCALERRHVCLDLVKLLVKGRLASVREPDDRRRIPLHYAVEAGHAGAVSLLMEAWRGSHLVRDGEGKCAMHVAFSGKSSLGVIELLINEAPSSLDERDSNGRLPVHLAGALRYPDPHVPDAVKMLLDIGGHTLLLSDKQGQLPLHAAIASADGWDKRAIEIVLMMIRHGSAALELRDTRERLPLHVAVAKDVPADRVVQELVDANPESLHFADASGRLPIHVALAKSTCPPLDLIQRIVGPWPESLQVADSRGLYPLHRVLYKHNLNLDGSRIGNLVRFEDRVHLNFWPVVQYLVRMCPAAIHRSDRSGRLPLHAAAARGQASWPELLQLLVHASPNNNDDSRLHRDKAGRLPLHLAVLAPRVSWTSVEILAGSRPQSLQVRDRDGFNPALLAATRDAPLNVLYRLLLLWPPLLRADD